MHEVLLHDLLHTIIPDVKNHTRIHVLLWLVIIHLLNELQMLLKVISKERRHKTYSFMCVDFGKQWGKLKDLLLEQIKLISVVSVLILAPKS